jgi:uncharacterized pyridoxal phosphate-containing UPF0001 family protein
MAIPSKAGGVEQLRHEFKQLALCYQKLKAQYPHIDTLSMGMSGDLDLAIQYGSTMVRIGTAIFGARAPK